MTTSRDVTLLNSFVDYVLDVKPYHTKIKQFLSEIFFEDSFNVNVTESLNWAFFHQNVWTRNDVGGYRLQRLCEGIPGDKTFRIPAAVWPRWSLNDRLTYGQSPHGDDPATTNLTDANLNGIPDEEQPWTGANSSSHFLGSDFIPGNPTLYRVPFHQGSRVYVDGVPQTFGTDYTVDVSRSFIRFAIAPGVNQHIEVQLMKVDRLFIAYNYPFDYDVNLDYDMYGYDMLPYDSNENPGILDSDYFRVTIDSGQPLGYQPVLFHNSVPYRLPKAKLVMTGVTGATITGDIWKITAIGPWKFKVQKNDVGTIWYANFKEPFDNGEISFIIDRMWCNYYLVPDDDSYNVISFDETDFLVNLNLVTEHGVPTDPLPVIHRPMEFILPDFITSGMYPDELSYLNVPGFSIGKVKKIVQAMIPGPLEYYAFVLTDTPPRGTYIELRVEQNGQLNPWFNATITDDMYLRVNYVSPAASRLIHNVNITGTVYEEFSDVDELVVYHGRDVVPSSIVVTHNAVPLVLSTVVMTTYFEGVQLPANSIGVDNNRVIVNLSSPQTVTVTLTF